MGMRDDRSLCRFTCEGSSVQLCSLSLLERDTLIGILDFRFTAGRQIPLSLAIFCDAMPRRVKILHARRASKLDLELVLYPY